MGAAPEPAATGECGSGAAPAALAGLRVIDLSRVLAGPYCAQLFADFGADVIKVEDRHGDENRRWEPMLGAQSANFMSVNRGKRAMTLDLKQPAGLQVLQALVRRADVLVHSFLPDVAGRLGLDADGLHRLNPRLVQVVISGYGDTGPMRGLPGYDLMLQAFSGMMSITGEMGGGPVRAGASVVDMATGMLAYGGAMSALWARAQGRAQGQAVRVSLLETSMALLGYHLVDVAATGTEPPRGGSGVWHLVPYQAFQTADGWVLAGATNDATWERFCRAIGEPQLAAHPDYRLARDRVRQREPLIHHLARVFLRAGTADWLARLQAERVPCAPVHDLRSALQHPQVAASQMLLPLPDAEGTVRVLPGIPIKLGATPGRPGTAPPLLGQHTDDILRTELGLDDEAIGALRAQEAI